MTSLRGLLLGSIFGAVLLPLAACGGPTVNFDVVLEGDTEVQGAGLFGQVLSQLPLLFQDFTTLDVSTTEAFENNQAHKAQVQQASVTALSLTVTDPLGDTFDFLDDIAFYVEAPGLDRVRVARRVVPRDERTFELFVDDDDLGAYVRADTLSLTTDATGRLPIDTTTVHAEVVLNVTAGLSLQ